MTDLEKASFKKLLLAQHFQGTLFSSESIQHLGNNTP